MSHAHAEHPTRFFLHRPGWAQWLGTLVLLFLALHSTSYGLGFVADPAQGAREFGDTAPQSQVAAHLAGLVGVGLLMLAATALVATVLLLRGHPGGGWLTLGIGLELLGVGVYWTSVGNSWDGGFYTVVGLMLAVTGSLSIRRPG